MGEQEIALRNEEARNQAELASRQAAEIQAKKEHAKRKATPVAEPVVLPIQEPETKVVSCLLYTSPSPRDRTRSRMPSSA